MPTNPYDQTKYFFNLGGVSYAVWGDVREARKRCPVAHKMLFQTKLDNVHGLDLVERYATMPDGVKIYVVSHFGQDRANIFIPPVFGGRKEEKERIEEEIIPLLFPAFEVCSTSDRYAEPIGIVLCRGGGFNGPYEFISKDDLPWYDHGSLPAEPLPEQRNWWNFNRYPDRRKYEDIVPAGVTDPEFYDIGAPVGGTTLTGGWTGDLITGTFGTPPIYQAASSAHWQYERREDSMVPKGFAIDNADGSISPLAMSTAFYTSSIGGGTCEFTYEVAYGMGDSWPQAIADAEADYLAYKVPMHPFWIANFEEDFYAGRAPHILKGNYSFTYVDTNNSVSDYEGSIKDQANFALAYEPSVLVRTTEYIRPLDISSCVNLIKQGIAWVQPEACYTYEPRVLTDTITDNPVVVMVDDTAFTPGGAMDHANVKYFQVGSKHIGLFFLDEDFRYIYAEVSPENQKIIVTPAEEPVTLYGSFEVRHPIAGLTDGDDNPLYCNGKFRLIREMTFSEEVIKERSP